MNHPSHGTYGKRRYAKLNVLCDIEDAVSPEISKSRGDHTSTTKHKKALDTLSINKPTRNVLPSNCAKGLEATRECEENHAAIGTRSDAARLSQPRARGLIGHVHETVPNVTRPQASAQASVRGDSRRELGVLSRMSLNSPVVNAPRTAAFSVIIPTTEFNLRHISLENTSTISRYSRYRDYSVPLQQHSEEVQDTQFEHTTLCGLAKMPIERTCLAQPKRDDVVVSLDIAVCPPFLQVTGMTLQNSWSSVGIRQIPNRGSTQRAYQQGLPLSCDSDEEDLLG